MKIPFCPAVVLEHSHKFTHIHTHSHTFTHIHTHTHTHQIYISLDSLFGSVFNFVGFGRMKVCVYEISHVYSVYEKSASWNRGFAVSNIFLVASV